MSNIIDITPRLPPLTRSWDFPVKRRKGPGCERCCYFGEVHRFDEQGRSYWEPCGCQEAGE